MDRLYGFFICLFLWATFFVVIIVDSEIDRFNSPARFYEQGPTIDGYIVEAVVSDTQLYATLPNDDTVYLLTVSVDEFKELTLVDKIFTPVHDYINVVDVQIPNGDKSAPTDLHK